MGAPLNENLELEIEAPADVSNARLLPPNHSSLLTSN